MDLKSVIYYGKLKDTLLGEGFTELEAREAIRTIRKMDKSLKKTFYRWFVKREAPDVTVEGISYDELTEDMRMGGFRAFLYLDWLSKEPQSAKAALAMEDAVVAPDPAEDPLAGKYTKEELGDEPEDTSDIVVDD
jgi:hypothetical protein